ncbi:putative glycosyltransferase [Tieghemostelium lacteum]|uniref:Putative glycosyltransferase n=1 Tax=Tieghemostelium lacteum TaxID=361077 RepID=A0A151Z2Y8_TIELA|nr:putative glycosyltransferase [Tieghemostelium lacteum]|eukprot:KYQ88174.1 putative glycosyltransferase [Tieghemostelium lacteum]
MIVVSCLMIINFNIELIQSSSENYQNRPYFSLKLLKQSNINNDNNNRENGVNSLHLNQQTVFHKYNNQQYQEKIKEYQSEIDKRIEQYRIEHQQQQDWRIKHYQKNPQETRKPALDFYQGLDKEFQIFPDYLKSLNSQRTKQHYDISIVTQTTVDRLEKVKLMAEKWLAPLSVAVFILNEDKDIDILEKYVSNCPILQEFCDFHLLLANHTRYPVNNLRNLAIQNSKTEFVFNLDVDFLPPLGLHQYIREHIHKQKNDITYSNSEDESKFAFVVPSFSSSIHPKNHPDDKLKLTELVYQHLVEPSNLKLCWNCHSPTNFTHWFQSNEAYQIRYKWIYEPYLIYNRTNAPTFDERLKGYGFDKNSHSFVLAVSGYRFIVLPHAFIIHINHESSNWQGPSVKDQLWDSLSIACDIIKDIKLKYNYSLDDSMFNEPILSQCFTDLHW